MSELKTPKKEREVIKQNQSSYAVTLNEFDQMSYLGSAKVTLLTARFNPTLS